MIKASIIIPVFNQLEYTRRCLKALEDNTPAGIYEVIIVDNASMDGTKEFLESLDNRIFKIISNKENLGFAKASNQGAQAASSDYLLFLNNDTEPQENWLFPLLNVIERDPLVGAVGSKLLFPDGTIQHAGVVVVDDRRFPGPLAARHIYYQKPGDLPEANQLMTYQVLTAACLLVRKSIFNQVQGFDEGYWNGYEDIDLCFKLQEKGLKLVYQPKSVVVHHESKSGPERFTKVKHNVDRLHHKWLNKIRPDMVIKKNGSIIQTEAQFIRPYLINQTPGVKFEQLPTTTKENLTSIVILTFNQLKYTKECVESIRKYTPEPHEIIFVDNGSTDGTVKRLKQLVRENPNYQLIENGKNLGFAKGCNQGIMASSGEYVLLLNNDVIVTKGWFSGLIGCLKNTPNAGIIGPMTNNISGPQKIEDAGYRREDLDRYAGAFRESHRHRRVPARRIVGFCMLFRRNLVNTIGLLDESFGSGNFEDDDFCLRASLMGYQSRMAGDVFIHHYGSRSFIGNRIDYTAAMTGNRSIFNAKWSGIAAKTPLGMKMLSLRAIEAADEFHQKGETDKAVEALIGGIKHAPDEPEIYHRLAEILIDSKNFKEASDALHSMPEHSREELRSLVLLGACYEGFKDYEKAEQCAERALSLKPDSAPALNLKGMVAYRANDPGKAVDLFNKAIEADPGYGEPHTNLGVLKWAAGQKEEALELLERGFILDPTVSDIAALYHSAVTATGSFERAERPFREAKGLYPNNKRIVFLLTDVLIQQERFSDAMREIEYSMSSFGLDDGLLSAALEIRNKIGALEIHQPSKKATLTLCMIVKNEEQNLVRCLSSAKPIVDEMIVVDTGSTDGTVDIAKAFGARVFDFEWKDSFAEARNFSLSKARGHWILILDADEVISPLDYGRLMETLGQRRSRPAAYTITTRNYVKPPNVTGWTANDGRYGKEEAGTGWVPSGKVRLFPNDRRIRFENPVHELVRPSLNKIGMKIIECGIPVHHYGRLDESKVMAKGEGYYRLGKRKLEEKAGDAKSLYELAIQAGEIGQFTDAIELWQKFLRRDSPLQKEMLLEACLNMGNAYIELGNYEEAFRALKKAMETDSNSREAILNYALIEFWVGDPQQAILPLQKLMEKEPHYPPALGLLSAIYLVCGRKEIALEHLEKVKKMGFDCAAYLYDQANRLTATGRFQRAVLLLEAAIETNNINENTHKLLSECHSHLKRQPIPDATPH